MRTKIILIIGLTSSFLFFFNTKSFSAVTVPAQPAIVSVQGSQLMVSWRNPDGSLSALTPYIIRGVNWTAATRAPATGPNPSNLDGTHPQYPLTVQYGFFFDWPDRDKAEGQQGHDLNTFWIQEEYKARYLADLSLMQTMRVNTIRIYSDFNRDPAVSLQILDECYRRGMMVVMTVIGSAQDFASGQYLTVVDRYKNHPAILMWAIGNEWNFNTYYGLSITDSILKTENAAQLIKQHDPIHPVSSSLGDRFSVCTTGCPPGSDIPSIVQAVPDVDVWGLNIYRGASFGTLFDQWRAVSSKPFYLGEFGIDSFKTQSYTVVQCSKAVNVVGVEDQGGQANIDNSLWLEIAGHLSAFNSGELNLGGFIFQFNDSLWKVGNYNVGLGGVVNYNGPDGIPGTPDDDTSYDEYNTEGFILPGPLDQIFNEEYYGLVNADRAPKQSFLVLQNSYKTISYIFTDDPLSVRTVVKAQHITELRTAVNTLRQRAGLAVAAWTDTTLAGTKIKAVHLEELRAKLTEALQMLGLPVPVFTDSPLTGKTIKAVHVQELRDALKW